MTKNILIFIYLIAFIPNGKAQSNYFEGTIHYKISYTGDSASIETYKKIMGTQSEYIFKEGNYKESFISSANFTAYYNKEENKNCFKTGDNDTIKCYSGNGKVEKILNIYKKAGKEENILGLNCKILTMTKDWGGMVTYYYNETIRVNPLWFSKNYFGSFNVLYRNTKSIPLKIVYNYLSCVVTLEATSIEPGKVNESAFKLPADFVISYKK